MFPYTIFMISVEVLQLFIQWWLGVIGSNKDLSNISFNTKIVIYVVSSACLFIMLIIRAIISAFCSKRSNRLIHKRLTRSLLNATQFFYDVTPIGKIMNRFTSDLN